MNLFKLENNKVVISEEAYMLVPFKKIWNRDKTIKKEKAKMELALLYFYCDTRSEYANISDDDRRLAEILEGEGFNKDYKMDKLMEEACEFYSSFKTPSQLLLEGMRIASNNLRNYIIDISGRLDEEADNGKPKYSIKDIAGALNQLDTIALKMSKTERLVNKDIEEGQAVRGGDSGFSEFENGISDD